MSGRWALIALWGGSLIATFVLPAPAQILAELDDPRAVVVLGAIVSMLAATLSGLIAIWGSLVVTVGLLAHVPNTMGVVARRTLGFITPTAARRTVGLALGLAILGSAPAYAAAPGMPPGSDHPTINSTELPVVAVDLDWPMEPLTTEPGPNRSQPRGADDAPTAPSARTVPHAPAAAAETPEPDTSAVRIVVTVARGDCLWAIAAHHLPRTASPAQIDAAWRSWYEENRDVIGSDPDLLTPGQQLLAPADPMMAATGVATHQRGGSS